MEIKLAFKNLEIARAKQKELRIEIDYLRNIIKDAGFDPDGSDVVAKRNEVLFSMFQQGRKVKKIAAHYQLKPGYVTAICSRELKVRKRDANKHQF